MAGQKTKAAKQPGTIRSIIKIMRLAWSFTPGYIIFTIIEGLNRGASYAIGIMYLERLFDLLMTFLIFVMAILNSLFFNKSDHFNMNFRREAN